MAGGLPGPGLLVLLPLSAYLLFSYRYLAGSVQAEAGYAAHAANHIVAANPEMWRYESVRLLEAVAQRPGDGEEERRVVLDAAGGAVVEVGGAVPAPRLVRSWPLHDAGLVVGRVEVTRTLRSAPRARTRSWRLVLVPLALLAFGLLRSQPLRAIRLGEEALRASEARFRALTEHAADMILVFDDEGCVRYWSRSAEEALGWAASEVMGRRLTDLGLIHPDDLPLFEEGRHGADASLNEFLPVTIRYRHRDGTWRLVEGLARSLLDDPAVRGVVVNARDVTEQRRLEEQLRQAQKLESIGRLAGGVAHDFNNLLTVILGCAAGIREAQAEGRPVDPEDVEQIQEAGERARDFTSQLLAFARKQVISPVAARPQRRGPRERAAAAPRARRGHPARGPAAGGALAHALRPRADRAGAPQPGGQRPRRHAAGREARHRDPQRGRPSRSRLGVVAPASGSASWSVTPARA